MTRRSRILCAACAPLLATLACVMFPISATAADSGEIMLACGSLALFYILAMAALACLGAALLVE